MPGLIASLLIGGGSAALSSVLVRKALPMKNSRRFIRFGVRTFVFFASLAQPWVALLLGGVVLGRKVRDAIGNRLKRKREEKNSPKYKIAKQIEKTKEQLQHREQVIKSLKDKIERGESLSRSEQRTYDNFCKEIPELRQELQDLFVQKGRLVRAEEGSQPERLSAIHMVTEPDGRKKFYLPHDASEKQLQEMRRMIIEKYNLPMDTQDILIGEHRQKDFKQGFQVEFDEEGNVLRVHSVLCFDEKENEKGKEYALDNFGEKLPEWVEDYVKGVDEKYRGSVHEFTELNGDPEQLELSGAMRMVFVSPESVAIVKDNQVLALAVAGADGKIRLNGVDTSVLSKKNLLLASRLYEDLGQCQDLESWCEKAAKHVLSSENVTLAAKATDGVRKKADRKESIKNALNKILGPDDSRKSVTLKC